MRLTNLEKTAAAIEVLMSHKYSHTIWGMEKHTSVCSCGERIEVPYPGNIALLQPMAAEKERAFVEHQISQLNKAGYLISISDLNE